MSDADEPLDPIGQCVAISFANHARGAPGEPPAATLYEIVDAVRAWNDRPPDADGTRSIRMVPDPRLIAAIVACRDYEGEDQDRPGGIEPIVVMKCARTGRTKALIVCFVDDQPNAVGFDSDYCPEADEL